MIEVGLKTELCELAERYGTDKYFFYTSFYHELLKDRRNIKKVLELGIGYPGLMLDSLSRVGRRDYTTGASLYMWRDYFPEAEIYALDNHREILINEGRIHSFWCDQSDASTYPLAELGKGFDLIIEDGSHVRDHQLTAAETLIPLLSPSGIYITEDIGYLTSLTCRQQLAREIGCLSKYYGFKAQVQEFHNPLLGSHIAAIVVVRK